MTILLYIIMKYGEKKFKCVSEQKILTVEDLCQNVLRKKMCFHFRDYPM